MEGVLVSGVTANKGEAKVTIQEVPDRPGIAAAIFKDIAKADINVDMIIQNISTRGYTDLSFTVPIAELSKTKEVVSDIVKKVKFARDWDKRSKPSPCLREPSAGDRFPVCDRRELIRQCKLRDPAPRHRPDRGSWRTGHRSL